MAMLPRYPSTATLQLLLCACFTVLATTSLDAQIQWRPANTGLDGAVVLGFGFGRDGEVFAGTRTGVYRFIAASESWERVLADAESRAIGLGPGGVLITGDANRMLRLGRSGFLISADANRMFRSVDNGATWQPGVVDSATAMKFLTAPDGTMYAVTWRDIRRSDDSGKSWRRIGTAIHMSFCDATLTRDGRLVVVNGANYVSTDSGKSWRKDGKIHVSSDRGESFQDVIVQGMGYVETVVRTAGDTLIAGTPFGIWMSADGIDWRRIGDLRTEDLHASPDGYLYALLDNSDTYDSTPGGIHRSGDNGRTWRRLTTDLPAVNTVARDPYGRWVTNPSGLEWRDVGSEVPGAHTLAVGPDGALWQYRENSVFRSVDSGESWRNVGRGLTNMDVVALASDESGRLYAMLKRVAYPPLLHLDPLFALYSSENNGESWVLLKEHLTNQKLEVFPGGHLFISTDLYQYPAVQPDRILLHSSDQGRQWQRVPGHGGWRVTASSGNGIFAAGFVLDADRDLVEGGITISTDNGKSWKPTTFTMPVHSIGITARGTIVVSAYRNQGGQNHDAIYRSTDLGETWQMVADSLPLYDFGAWSDGHLFADGGNKGSYGIRRSTDDGLTWQITGEGASTDGFTFTREGQILTSRSGLRSNDSGASWSRMSFPALEHPIKQIISAQSGELLAMSGTMIWRSSDNGPTWQSIGDAHSRLWPGKFVPGAGGYLLCEIAGGGIYRSSEPVTGSAGLRQGSEPARMRPDLLDLSPATVPR